MTKSELIMQVSKGTGISAEDTRAVIESTMERIKESMAQGKNIYLRGFGSFIRVRRARKVARNINLGESVILPERVVPKFKPCRAFMNRIR